MTKTLLALAFMTMLGVGVQAQSKLEVSVKGIKTSKGNIRVGLFNSEEKFLKSAWKGQVVKASGGEITVVFDDVPSGTYAVSVIHDENENDELDSGFMGIPKEGFGFSKDAMGMFGPPKFVDASFPMTEGRSIEIHLKYM